MLTSRELRRAGLTLRARTWGTAGSPLVVLQHGLGANADSWAPVATNLAAHESGPRLVLAPDLRGHGRSDWDAASRYDVSELASDLTEWILATADRPCLLIGHSLGAAVAMTVAARRPEVVDQLVLEDGGPAASWLTASRRRVRGDIRQHFRNDADAMAELDRIFPGDTNPANYERRLASFFAAGEGGGLRWRCDIPRVLSPRSDPALLEESWAALVGLRCPVTIIGAGSRSKLDPDIDRRIAAVRPDINVVRVDEAGHDIHNSTPIDFLQILDPILDAQAASRRTPASSDD